MSEAVEPLSEEAIRAMTRANETRSGLSWSQRHMLLSIATAHRAQAAEIARLRECVSNALELLRNGEEGLRVGQFLRAALNPQDKP